MPECISPELVRNPIFLPRESPGQAMAVSRGSCRGRALRRPHTIHLVSPKSSHGQPYPLGPPAYEPPLPAPINCRKISFQWVVFGLVLLNKINDSGTYSSSSKNYGGERQESIRLDHRPIHSKKELHVVPGSKRQRSDASWGELKHPLSLG